MPINLDSLPFIASIDIINLDSLTQDSIIGAQDTMYYCGFCWPKSEKDFVCSDSLLSAYSGTEYSINDSIIYVNDPGEMQGCSGSPIFLDKNRKETFIGIWSTTDTQHKKGYIFTKTAIRSSLHRILSR